MKKYILSKDIKNKMKRELMQYYDNIELLQRLKENEKISTRRYIYIEQQLQYIRNVISKLNSTEQEAFDIIFKEKYNFSSRQVHKYISRATYYRVFNKATYLLAEEWGEI